jgi:signal transduction histidine kinase
MQGKLSEGERTLRNAEPREPLGASLVVENDATRGKLSERERRELTHALEERVKELVLLHETARRLECAPRVDETLLSDLVGLIPPAWQYPEVCEARIAVGTCEALTPGFRPSTWNQTVTFTTSQGQRGTIEVVYLEPRPDMLEGPFLLEERNLLQSFAEMLRVHAERKENEQALKRAEERLRQAEKMDAVGRLAAGIAHDFNNLLSGMTISTDLLALELGPKAAGMEYVTEIRSATERAVGLIRQLLAFSRQQVLEPRVLNLTTLLLDFEKMLSRMLGANVVLHTQYEPALGEIRADPGQIQQLVLNLAVNAHDAMPAGGTLAITTTNVEYDAPIALGSATMPKGSYVELSVADTGVGIDPLVKLRIFDPFFTTKETGKGTGLGLATVYGIVQQSGGAIDVESEPGRGTCFRILFPRIRASGECV